MEKYSISQTPSGKNKKSRPASQARGRAKSPSRRQARSLDPRLVLGGIVLVAALVLAGLAWVRFSSQKPEVANGQTGRPAAGVSPSKRDAVTAAVENKQPSGLDRFYASKVRVVMPGFNKLLSGSEVAKLIGNPLTGAQAPWNWHVPPGDLSNWQTGPYGQYLEGDVVVGESDDGTVIIIGFDDDGNIDTVVIIPVKDLEPTNPNPGSGSDTTSPGTTPGGGTTPDGTTTPPATNPSTIPFSD